MVKTIYDNQERSVTVKEELIQQLKTTTRERYLLRLYLNLTREVNKQ